MIWPMNAKSENALQSGLEKLNTYYEVGDYRRAKRLALELIDAYAPDGGDRERIDHVLTATRIDPLAIGAIVFTIALAVHLFVVYAV